MLDIVVFAVLVIGFATFVTVHVSLLAVLTISHAPRWRGVVALLLPPLAPVWGWQVGRKKMAVCWGAALVIYGAGLIVAQLR